MRLTLTITQKWYTVCTSKETGQVTHFHFIYAVQYTTCNSDLIAWLSEGLSKTFEQLQ